MLSRLHDVDREEDAVARALASGTALDDAVPDPTPLDALDPVIGVSQCVLIQD